MIDKQDGIILIEMMTECYKQVAYGEISGRSIPNTTYTLVECWCTLHVTPPPPPERSSYPARFRVTYPASYPASYRVTYPASYPARFRVAYPASYPVRART
jgi:hypothetical protein